MSDLIGKKFGKLKVLCLSDRKGAAGQPYLYCKCDCGKEKEVRRGNLVSGQVKSCGCGKVTSTNKNQVHLVINKHPPRRAKVSQEKKNEFMIRKKIEDIHERRALEQELYGF